MQPIDKAVEYLESLPSDKDFTYTEVARKFGVSRTTLSRRFRRVQSSREAIAEQQGHLNYHEEAELVRYIKELSERALPPTRTMIKNFAAEISKNTISTSWVTRFLQRHDSDLISKWTTGMDRNRHEADSEHKYRLYFEHLHHKMIQYHIHPASIYNMDEKGFLTGIIGRSKRVFSKAIWERKQVREATQDGSRDWITLLACVCADGSALSPALLFTSQNSSIQSSWVDSIEAGKHQVFVSSTPTGWTNDDVGLSWLEQVFDRETKLKAPLRWRLLILDGHGSHVTMKFISYCHQNRILLCVLPPHSTQTLQPLDVAIFKPLADAYSNELTNYLHQAQGLIAMQTIDFFPLFWSAWSSSIVKKTVLSAFEHTGIEPMNAEVILQRWRNKTPEQHSSRESSTSVVSRSDWQKLRQITREAVHDELDLSARKLSSSVNRLIVQNKLLRAENNGLRKAVKKKKRQQKKSKALPLQPRDEYHGGSIFWSPRAVAGARVREKELQDAKHQEELEKAQIKELKQASKLYKEKIMVEKRVMREKERAAKAQLKAEKAAELAARREAARSSKPLPKPQKRKNIAQPEPQPKAKRSQRAGGAAAAAEVVPSQPAAPTRTTRHGRTTTLPKKFQ